MADAKLFLITDAEALQELDTGVKSQAALLEVIESTSEEIETWLRRRIVSRGSITEYHEVMTSTADLYLKQRPIVTVTSVHETTDRTYDSTTLITENTGFLVYLEDGRLVRMSAAARTAWIAGGLKSIQVIYSAGVATIHDVPADIKSVCRELVASRYREIVERSQNQESTSDDFGTVRRRPPMMTGGQVKRLAPHRNALSNTWVA
jgi:hypothetical protein